MSAEKGSHGAPEAAVFRRARLQAEPLAGFWEMGFLERSHCCLTDNGECPVPRLVQTLVSA